MWHLIQWQIKFYLFIIISSLLKNVFSKKVHSTYGSCKSGEILRTMSKKFLSEHQMDGRWGWLFTFKTLNKIHKITATTARRAVDMMAAERPNAVSCTNTATILINSTFCRCDTPVSQARPPNEFFLINHQSPIRIENS